MSKLTRLSLILTIAVALAPMAPAASDGQAMSGEIVALKALHLETPLVANGASNCRIVTPGDNAWQQAGRRVQEALTKACGVKIDLLDAAAVADDDYGRFNLIVIGNMMNNRVVAKLYSRHYCFTDALYPGRQGYEVRTIHNPMGNGRNCVLLGASDEAGVNRAVDRFIALLGADGLLSRADGGQTVKLGRLLAAESALNPKQKADDAFVAQRTRVIGQALDNGVVRGQMGGIVDAAMSYYLTGDDGWARIFRASLLHYYDLAKPTGDWALLELSNDPGGQYFWPWKVVMMWDNVEECPVFSDADRLKITNLLLHLTRWVADRDYFHVGRPKSIAPDELRQNHPTYATLSLFFGSEYFRMYYPAIHEFEARYADMARIFGGQASSYKSNDNGTVYSPLAPQQYLCYLMTRGELDPRAARNLRALADSVVITTDNRADASTYGDTPGYIIGHTRGLPFLAKAAWYWQDAGYRWAFNWIQPRSWGRGEALDGLFGDTWYQGLYHTDGPQLEPSRLQGVAPLMVDEGLYEFMRKKLGAAATSPAIEQCFDKLSMRRNFSAADEYLLLSGLSGVLVHAHEDGNSVLRLTWRDRVWLANLGYRARVVGEHNSLVVRREGQDPGLVDSALPDPDAESNDAGFVEPPSVMPAFVALESHAELPAAGFTRTTVTGYNGVDWSRNIVWRKGEYFLFFDDVRARQPGTYQLRLIWRTLGQPSLAGNDLRVHQDGETFNIKSADHSRKNLSIKKQDSNSEWSRYEHADGTVRILSEMQEFDAPKSAGHIYVNLLFPGEPTLLAMDRIGERTVRILRGNETRALVGLAADRNDCGNFLVQAAAYQITREGLMVFDARKVSLAGLELQCEQPLSLQLDWSTAQGTVSAAQETDLGLNATAIVLDERRIAPVLKAGLAHFSVPAGTHRLKLEGQRLLSISAALEGTYAIRPVQPAPPPVVPQLREAWRINVPSPLEALTTGDLVGDGTPDVVVAAGDRVRALSAAGVELWSHQAASRITHLQVGDINRDGKNKVVFTAGTNVYLLDGAGKEQWRYACLHFKSPLSALILADLERDGRLEILAGNERSALFAVNGDGSLRWQSYKDIGRAGITALLADDFDGDGQTGVFVGTGRGHGAVMLTHDGRQAKWHVPGSHHVAGAITQDGKKVMMIGGPETIGPARILDPKPGRTRKLIPIADDVIAIVPADLDGDGKQEFVTAFRTAGVYRFDASGQAGKLKEFGSFPLALAVADFDRDCQPDIAVGAQDGRIWIMDARGMVKAAADLGSPITALGVLTAGKSTRLVAGSVDGVIAMFRHGD